MPGATLHSIDLYYKQAPGKYAPEFKLEAVRKVNAGQSVSVTAKILGTPKALLGRGSNFISPARS